jgi:hypothetical protein
MFSLDISDSILKLLKLILFKPMEIHLAPFLSVLRIKMHFFNWDALLLGGSLTDPGWGASCKHH